MTLARIIPSWLVISLALAIAALPQRAGAETNLRGAGSTFSAALYN